MFVKAGRRKSVFRKLDAYISKGVVQAVLNNYMKMAD